MGAWSRFHYHPDIFLRMAASDKQQGMAWTRIRNFLAGYSSGVCLVLAGHPFDTIKVKVTAVWLVVLLAHMSGLPLPTSPTTYFLSPSLYEHAVHHYMHVSDRVSQLVCKQTAHKNRGNIQKVHPHGEHSSIVEGKEWCSH